MKQIKTILTCGLVLASVGFASLVVADGASRQGNATVRSVHGDVQYQLNGSGDWKKLRVNAELPPSTVLKSTGSESVAYLQVNGFTSTVKLTSDTTITLAKMEQMGGFATGDSTTELKLDKGTVQGSVRKISANSTYQVAVPNGVAGIRGTDFSVTVTVNQNGTFTVDFRSVTGQLVCSVANIGTAFTPGSTATQSQSLQTGQTWTVTGNADGTTATINVPTATPPEVTTAIVSAIQQAITIVNVVVQTQNNPPSAPPQPPPQPTTNPSTTGGGSGTGSDSGDGGGGGVD